MAPTSRADPSEPAWYERPADLASHPRLRLLYAQLDHVSRTIVYRWNRPLIFLLAMRAVRQTPHGRSNALHALRIGRDGG